MKSMVLLMGLLTMVAGIQVGAAEALPTTPRAVRVELKSSTEATSGLRGGSNESYGTEALAAKLADNGITRDAMLSRASADLSLPDNSATAQLAFSGAKVTIYQIGDGCFVCTVDGIVAPDGSMGGVAYHFDGKGTPTFIKNWFNSTGSGVK